MRLRLEQLLLECPRHDAAAGSSSSGMAGAPLSAADGSGGDAAAGFDAASTGGTDARARPSIDGSAGQRGEDAGSGGGARRLLAPLHSLTAATLEDPSSRAQLDPFSRNPSFPGASESASASSSAANSVSGSLAASLSSSGQGAFAARLSFTTATSSPPLERELVETFPPPPGALPGSEATTVAAAKRCIARLLAWAPPPHQLTFAKLGAQVRWLWPYGIPDI